MFDCFSDGYVYWNKHALQPICGANPKIEGSTLYLHLLSFFIGTVLVIADTTTPRLPHGKRDSLSLILNLLLSATLFCLQVDQFQNTEKKKKNSLFVYYVVQNK